MPANNERVVPQAPTRLAAGPTDDTVTESRRGVPLFKLALSLESTTGQIIATIRSKHRALFGLTPEEKDKRLEPLTPAKILSADLVRWITAQLRPDLLGCPEEIGWLDERGRIIPG